MLKSAIKYLVVAASLISVNAFAFTGPTLKCEFNMYPGKPFPRVKYVKIPLNTVINTYEMCESIEWPTEHTRKSLFWTNFDSDRTNLKVHQWDWNQKWKVRGIMPSDAHRNFDVSDGPNVALRPFIYLERN